jgi:hypothetical protein
MQDAIGHELNIGDYVTATWTNNVALFKIIGTKSQSKSWRNSGSELKLERMFSYPGNKSNGKLVYRFENQVTWVDPDYVTIHLLKK